MRDQALHIIRRIRKKWRAVRFVSLLLFTIALLLPVALLVHHFAGGWVWVVVIVLVGQLPFVTSIDRSWRITDVDVARFLNTNYPTLEESTELLLEDQSALNLLQRLQVNKTATALTQAEEPALYKKMWEPLLAVLVSVLISILLLVAFKWKDGKKDQPAAGTVATENAVMPAGVKDVAVKMIPPAYTGKPIRAQRSMNIEVEEGAMVEWAVTLHSAAKEVKFIYNDSLAVSLKPGSANLKWTTERKIDHSGFYQLKIDGTLSELYRIEVKKDNAPVITIASPKPSTVIEYGDPERVNIQANVSDDYGVKDVVINATVAKGSGEAVTFKAQKISFGVSFAEKRLQYALQKMIGLRALGMEPGDELYFYLSAIDNHDQEKRSDIYIVTITDTAKLMAMEGLLNGVNLKPDYFRSQRQIILDAEQLLRDRDTATAENFNNRSNNLGIDQKLLRLRYGKFLGEEATSNEDVAGADLGNPGDFGNAAVILDAFTDHHDNAEDATFLDPETKKQLKATLTEMWNAELQLRLFKPKEALPYAYKALRLLKDLQQKSRAYVAKTSIKTAPIKLEKRLTGKLEKIVEPSVNTRRSRPDDVVESIRNALPVLEHLKKERTTNEKSVQTLRLASAQLGNYAAKEPAVYLDGLESMKKIITAMQENRRATAADIASAQRALQKIADAPALLPSKRTTSPRTSLQDVYFRNLQKQNN
ncbi:DUF4175 domain-containing protein [Sediminibacterium roseum]|uniref:DUF4175 domain-containing protein n=1 Tax=Sediminibacterium roseum TaxID=1978412 RepID=A0ABW9ZVW9_9BACT|nr:DUF4175 family protein [Sediminibacterium roseum]NCI49373.1 DUF4175 domain-containing protein [Sediminibacterium roseum]